MLTRNGGRPGVSAPQGAHSKTGKAKAHVREGTKVVDVSLQLPLAIEGRETAGKRCLLVFQALSSKAPIQADSRVKM
jgi:hypothetical protein